jgi:SNF family Na+-dependent transporter
MQFTDNRPERSLAGSILTAIGWLAVYYFAGQLVRQYTPPEFFQSFLEFLEEASPILLVAWIATIVLLFVVILQMPQE